METQQSFVARMFDRVAAWIIPLALGLAVFGVWRMGPELRGALLDGAWRILVWIVIVAVTPWSTKLFISRILELGTNWAGVALIAAFTLVDALAGWLLLTAWPTGPWSWLACLGALAVAGTYNYFVAEYSAQQAGG